MASRRSWFDSFLAIAAKTHARRQLNQFMRAARNAVRAQERTLLTKIARNADSDYGRKHGFSRIRRYQDFIARVPVQTYEDLSPYLERVMAGESSALFGPGQRIIMFAMTSGSTDKPKYVPVTPAFLAEYRTGWNAFGLKALLDHPGAFLGSILQVVSEMDEHRTELGVPCGSISGLLAATQKRLVRKYYTTPPQTARITDAEARYYATMRFAVPRDVRWMITASPATQKKLAQSAITHTESLIRDIRDGTLTGPGSIPDSVRQTLADRLEPDRETARRLDDLACEHGELLPRHYWRLAFLANWTGGTLGLHLQDFPHYFGSTPVRDIGLLATEGRVSVPLQDGTPAGVLDTGGSFFEFLDPDAAADDPDAVHRCHELIPKNEYRVLMTTSAGFYRYDIGDHIRVHGFLGQAPIVEFLHRGAHASSITGEKLTEWQVTEAFRRCVKAFDLAITEFVLAPQWADPPFYRLHIDNPISEPQRLAARLDAELSRINLEYRSKRSSGRLGAIQFNRLPDGTLTRIDATRLHRRSALHEQYKHQYLYTQPGQDDSLGGSPAGEYDATSVNVDSYMHTHTRNLP